MGIVENAVWGRVQPRARSPLRMNRSARAKGGAERVALLDTGRTPRAREFEQTRGIVTRSRFPSIPRRVASDSSHMTAPTTLFADSTLIDVHDAAEVLRCCEELSVTELELRDAI